MGIQPISNETLVYFLKYDMRRHGYNVTTLAKQIRMAEDDLEAVLDKRVSATPRMLARVSILFGPGWRNVALQHAAWRFDHEMAKLSIPAPEQAKPTKADSIFNQMESAKRMIAEHPNMEVDLLAVVIHRALRLDINAVKRQIAYVRSETRGYNFHA